MVIIRGHRLTACGLSPQQLIMKEICEIWLSYYFHVSQGTEQVATKSKQGPIESKMDP